ncbi:MAG: phosphopantetheine-binding protein [Desulfarculaceae bacterium]|jgi:acyl carrier protein
MNDLAEKLNAFVRNRLVRLAQEKGLEAPTLEAQTNLLDLGILDSLGFVQMLMAMEDEFDLELDFSELDPEEFTTLEGLVTTALACAQAA